MGNIETWPGIKSSIAATAPPDQVLWLAETEPRRVMAMVFKLGKRSSSFSHTYRYCSASTFPAVTSLSGALMPKTLSASSSLPMATSQVLHQFGHHLAWCFAPLPQFLAVIQVAGDGQTHFFGGFDSFQANRGGPPEMAGVIPVQWNQSASAKTVCQSIMPGSMVEMAECARS